MIKVANDYILPKYVVMYTYDLSGSAAFPCARFRVRVLVSVRVRVLFVVAANRK